MEAKLKLATTPWITRYAVFAKKALEILRVVKLVFLQLENTRPFILEEKEDLLPIKKEKKRIGSK